jgi:endonuclease-3
MGKDIYSTGFYNNKAKNIIAAAQRILTVYNGEVPTNIEDLLTVPGAARKTANVVLGTCFNIASGVVVDTHVSRISQRLDLTKKTDPVNIEKDLIKILPQSRWISFSHQLIHHGRGHCTARSPKCHTCPMNHLCYAKDKNA